MITINGSTGLSGVDGSSATPALQGTDTNTGISYGTDIVTINTGGTARVTTDASGNVGIGTASPASKLHVVGSFRQTGATAPFEWTVNSGAADFYKLNAVGYADNLFVATSAGNMGIGTSSPSTRLAVDGAIRSTTLSVVNSISSVNEFANLTVNSDGLNIVSSYVSSGSANIIFSPLSSERMRLDSSGNLLVGTTTVNGRISSVPKAGLAPAGTAGTWATAAAMSVSGAFGGGFSWIDGSGGYCAWIDDGGTDFNIAGGLTSNVVANGVFLNGYAATSWSARSDERLKQNLQPITDALNKTCSLRAVTGAYKNFPDEQQAFLLAQDVQKVLPEAVCVADKNSPEQYLGLAYTQVIPLLVAAIQELKAEIDLLKGN